MLVILAILAAILIPSMVRWIEKAKQKALVAECRACVTAAQGLVVETYGKTGAVAAPNEADILLLAELTGKGSIPYVQVAPATAQVEHLTYRNNAGDVVTYCRDGACGGHYIFRSVSGILYNGGDTPANTLSQAVTDTGVPMTTQNGRIDSLSDGTKTAAILDYFAANNVDLAAMNIRSWSVVQESATQRAFTFTDVDIASQNVGDMVRVIRYNERLGTYTAGYGMVTEGSTGVSAITYNQLEGTASNRYWKEYKTDAVVQDAVTKQNYATTLSIFNGMPATMP